MQCSSKRLIAFSLSILNGIIESGLNSLESLLVMTAGEPQNTHTVDAVFLSVTTSAPHALQTIS